MRTVRAAPALAWVAGVGVVALLVLALLLDGGTGGWKPVLVSALWLVPAVLVAAARPANPLGWLLLGVVGAFAGSGVATRWVEAGHTAGAGWAVWYADRGSAVIVPLTLAFVVLVPDGRLPAPRWRPVVIGVLATQITLVVSWSLLAGPAAAPDSTWPVTPENPVGVLPADWGPALDRASAWVLQLPLLLGAAAVAHRLRRTPEQRPRLVGLLVAVAVFVLLVVLGRALWPAAADLLDVAGAALLAAALTSALLRGRVHGVEVVLDHAFVHVALTAVVAGGYVAVVALAGALGADLPARAAGLVAAALAVALLPLRHALQHLLTRWMYGDTRDPGTALRRLGRSVREETELHGVLDGLASSIRASVRAAFVEVTADGDTVVHGRPRGGDRMAVPLCSAGQPLGAVTVELPPGRRFGSHERTVLQELAEHGARAVHAVTLAEDLLRSRQLLVTAREEERSVLRRELHDHLGPTLAGLSMQLGDVAALVVTDPGTATERLQRLAEGARAALDDVRRLSRDLRPPSLDELGLVNAVVRAGEEAGLTVRAVHDPLPPLSAAVEVAAYRLAVEALVNVARHSGADEATLRLAVGDDALQVQVRDCGTGIGSAPVGVGILSMRERAEELGGSLVVRQDAGTVVEAVLPLAAGGPGAVSVSPGDRSAELEGRR